MIISIDRKVVYLCLAPGLQIVDEVSRLSKYSAGTTTVKCIVRYIIKSKIKKATKNISTLIFVWRKIENVWNNWIYRKEN